MGSTLGSLLVIRPKPLAADHLTTVSLSCNPTSKTWMTCTTLNKRHQPACRLKQIDCLGLCNALQRSVSSRTLDDCTKNLLASNNSSIAHCSAVSVNTSFKLKHNCSCIGSTGAQFWLSFDKLNMSTHHLQFQNSCNSYM